jgi:hypothetical protein
MRSVAAAALVTAILFGVCATADVFVQITGNFDTSNGVGPLTIPAIVLLAGSEFQPRGYQEHLIRPLVDRFSQENITAIIGFPRAGESLVDAIAVMRDAVPRPVEIKLFIIAHSDAVTQVESMLDNNNERPAGIVLCGATFSRDYERVPNAPPTLTLGGDRDGVTRVMRYAESFFNRVIKPTQSEILALPVVVEPDFTHASFVDGGASEKILSRDLQTPLTTQDASLRLTELVFAFIVAQFSKQSDGIVSPELARQSTLTIVLGVEATWKLVMPLIDALLFESSGRLFPACGDLNDKDPKEPVKRGIPCWPGSAWSSYIQERMYLGPSADGIQSS